MNRTTRLVAAAAIAALLLLALSLYLHSWGGLALIAVAAGGYAWYRGDSHLHTVHSDGRQLPSEVAATVHDTRRYPRNSSAPAATPRPAARVMGRRRVTRFRSG